MSKKFKLDTSVLHSRAFKAALHEVLYKYAKDGDYNHAISRIIELVESELP